MGQSDTAFAGSIPELYDRHFVPMLFEPCAADLIERIVALRPSRVLEVAAGTGAVTRHLARALPSRVEIVATDLNPPMLERAAAVGTARPVRWQPADAQQLPFEDGAFDLVVCQFGVMFFPDKARAFSEARRVLGLGGHYLFNVWDRLEESDFEDEVTRALATVFPDDPPRFMARVPHGYHDRGTIAEDLRRGGWREAASFSTVGAISRAESARTAALAICQGTPLRNEIEARDASRLGEATDVAAAALTRRFGSGAIEGRIRALVVSIAREVE
jgi:SAM-dependent methyltransferase